MSTQDLSEEAKIKRIAAVVLAKAAKARTNINNFVTFVMREEVTRAKLTVASHQRIFFEFALAHPLCVIMLPVGMSKTFGMATLGLFFLGKDNTSRGAFVSATEGQAQKPLGLMKDYIEQSNDLHLVFPHLRPSQRQSDYWTQTKITVDRPPAIRDPSVMSVGIGGAIDGSRIKWVVVDDILTQENTSTPEQRDKVCEWVEKSVMSRIDPRGGRLVLTNTAWHPDDILHRYMDRGWPTLRMEITGQIEIKNTDWDPSNPDELRPEYPGSNLCRLTAHDPDSRNEVSLWPERVPMRCEGGRAHNPPSCCVEKLQETFLPGRFNQLYRNLCRDNESSMCKQEYVDKCLLAARNAGHYSFTNSYEGQNLVCIGVDLAVSPGEEHDDTAFFTFECLPNGQRMILEIEAGQWSGPEIVSKIKDKASRYKGSVVRVESNAAQDYIRQFILEADASFPIRAHCTGRAKAHPEHGVPGLFIEMNNGAWLIPNRGGVLLPQVKRFVDACLYYSPSRHTDDVLMACYFAREQAKEFGFGLMTQKSSVGQMVMSR